MNHNQGPILTLNLLGGTQQKSDGKTKTHNDDENNVGSNADGAFARVLGVEAQTDSTADDRSRGLSCLPNGCMKSQYRGYWS